MEAPTTLLDALYACIVNVTAADSDTRCEAEGRLKLMAVVPG